MRIVTALVLASLFACGAEEKKDEKKKEEQKKEEPKSGDSSDDVQKDVPKGDEGGDTPAQKPDRDVLGKAIAKVLEPTIDTAGKPGKAVGMAIGVVTPKGRASFGFGATEAKGTTKPDGKTVFLIGSITKVFSSLVLAEAAEKGELKLDDPIQKYLPDGIKSPSPALTLESLASHYSGLPNHPDDYPRPGPNQGDYTPEQLFAFLDRYELPRQPGAKYEYSNIGMALLGNLVMNRAQKRTFEQGVVDSVAKPLGMLDTTTVLDDARKRRMPKGYEKGQESPYKPREILVGSGNISSTADDMALFVEKNIKGVPGPLGAAMTEIRKVRGTADPNAEIGLGINVRKLGGRSIYVKTGTHNGYAAVIAYDLEAKVGFALLTNCFEYPFQDVVPALIKALQQP